MLSRIVVGTLSTLNTFMTPFSGSMNNSAPSYGLELNQASQRCPSKIKPEMKMQIQQGPEYFSTLLIHAEFCGGSRTTTSGAQPSPSGNLKGDKVFHEKVSRAVVLPIDLYDEKFIEGLPVGAPYIFHSIPIKPDGTGRTRIKVTRLAEISGLIPVEIEWLPTMEGATPSQTPLKLWMPKAPENRIHQIPWTRIELDDAHDSRLSLSLKVPSRQHETEHKRSTSSSNRAPSKASRL